MLGNAGQRVLERVLDQVAVTGQQEGAAEQRDGVRLHEALEVLHRPLHAPMTPPSPATGV